MDLPPVLARFINPEGKSAERVVPSTGAPVWLTVLSAAAMAFLAVFALALALTADRLGARWAASLAQEATIRISAPADQMKEQTQRVLEILATTPGVSSSRALDRSETQSLLEPWFGPDLPLESLPIPQLVALSKDKTGYDAQGLRLRLSAEVPGAVLDDHTAWREPLVAAAGRLRAIGFLGISLIGAVTAAIVSLAAQAALAANSRVIRVLRLIGAEDRFIARAFVRRFTLRTALGACAGTAAGMIGVALLPAAGVDGGFLTGLGLAGLDWLWPLVIPALAAMVAFMATRHAALKVLREVT
jgi:cell division transport system permease protein